MHIFSFLSKTGKTRVEPSYPTIKFALESTKDALDHSGETDSARPTLTLAVKILEVMNAEGIVKKVGYKERDAVALLAERVGQKARAVEAANTDPKSPPRLKSELQALNLTLEDVYKFAENLQHRLYITGWLKRRTDASTVGRLNVRLDKVFRIASMQQNQNLGIKVVATEELTTRVHISIETPTTPVIPSGMMELRGRNDEVKWLIDTLTDSRSPRVCIKGVSGVGKTALALQVMRSEPIASSFGCRRYFVQLDSATNVTEIIAALVLQIGLAGHDLRPRLLEFLELCPKCLIILDHLDTSWESPNRAEVQEFLGELGQQQNVTLVATIRSDEVGPHLDLSWSAWAQSLVQALSPLSLEDARDLLLSAVDCSAVQWDPLLENTGGLPFAIIMLGALIDSGETASSALGRWNAQRAGLPAQEIPSQDCDVIPAGDTRSGVIIETSIQVSLRSPSVTTHAHALDVLAPLALLPDGIEAVHFLWIFRTTDFSAYSVLSFLCAKGLVRRMDNTLVVPSSLRAWLSKNVKPIPALLDVLNAYYFSMAEHGSETWKTTDTSLPALTPHIRNIDMLLCLALDNAPSLAVLRAAAGYGEFTRFTGLGSLTPLKRIVSWRDRAPSSHLALYAVCQATLASIHLQQYEIDFALQHYQGALEDFRALSDRGREARCLVDMADAHLSRSELGPAESLFREGRPVFGALGDAIGEGRCLVGLGNLEMRRAKLDAAVFWYNEGLEAFGAANYRLGQRQCFFGLRDVHTKRGEIREALACSASALALLQSGDNRITPEKYAPWSE